MTGRLEACIRLAKRVGIKNKSILDVGCSDGWFCKIALDEGAQEVYAIEPDSAKIKQAKRIVPSAKIKKGVAGKLVFRRNKFDVVTLFDVLEHVPKNSEPQVFKEISRVLKPTGFLLISTPFDFWLSKIADPAWYFGHRHYSRRKLEKLLNEVGFRVKQASTHGCFWEALATWVLYISKWIFHTNMPFEEWFDIRRRREYREKGKMSIMIIAQKI